MKICHVPVLAGTSVFLYPINNYPIIIPKGIDAPRLSEEATRKDINDTKIEGVGKYFPAIIRFMKFKLSMNQRVEGVAVRETGGAVRPDAVYFG